MSKTLHDTYEETLGYPWAPITAYRRSCISDAWDQYGISWGTANGRSLGSTPIQAMDTLTGLQTLQSRWDSKILTQSAKFKRLKDHPMHSRMSEPTKCRMKLSSFLHQTWCSSWASKSPCMAHSQPGGGKSFLTLETASPAFSGKESRQRQKEKQSRSATSVSRVGQ